MQQNSRVSAQLGKRRSFTAVLSVILGISCAHASDLTVTIQQAKTTGGTVRAALFEEKTGWIKGGTPVRRQALRPQPQGTVFIFRDLPAGRYAISAFHDENDNEKLDTNVIGRNIEPIAFSRDARGRMGPPNFESAAFDFSQDMAITMTLH